MLKATIWNNSITKFICSCNYCAVLGINALGYKDITKIIIKITSSRATQFQVSRTKKNINQNQFKQMKINNCVQYTAVYHPCKVSSLYSILWQEMCANITCNFIEAYTDQVNFAALRLLITADDYRLAE